MCITEELWHGDPASARWLLSHLQFSSSSDWALCRALRIQKLMKPPYPRCLGFHRLLPWATPPFPAPVTSLVGISDTSSAAPTSATKSGPPLGYCRNPLTTHTCSRHHARLEFYLFCVALLEESKRKKIEKHSLSSVFVREADNNKRSGDYKVYVVCKGEWKQKASNCLGEVRKTEKAGS